jgi:hypothetical protein
MIIKTCHFRVAAFPATSGGFVSAAAIDILHYKIYTTDEKSKNSSADFQHRR